MSKYSPVADNVEDVLQSDGVSERKLAYHGDLSNAAISVVVAERSSNQTDHAHEGCPLSGGVTLKEKTAKGSGADHERLKDAHC